MKILITYYTGTGNTEKIANAIKEGIDDYEVDIFPVKEVDPSNLNFYDLIFLGSGIYGFNVSRKITSLVKKAPKIPPNLAYFYTHESQKNWPNAFKSVNKIIKTHGCKILGEFDCCGENLVEKAQEQREAMYSRLSPEEAEKAKKIFLNYVKGHPDEKDIENAQQFAKEIVAKV